MKYPKRKENKIKKLVHIISTSKNKISASEIAKTYNSMTAKQVAALLKQTNVKSVVSKQTRFYYDDIE